MLQHLIDYAERHLPDAEPGFKARELRWSIELAADGRLLGVVPLGDGKKGESCPRCPDMHAMNAGGKAHFLVETAQTAALLFKANEDPKKVAAAAGRHRFFATLLGEAAREVPALGAVAELLADPARVAQLRDALAARKAKPADWVGWRVDGRDPRQDPEVQAWWRRWRQADLGGGGAAPADGAMVCFLTGEPVAPLATQPKIGGLSGVGGLAMGDVMVGFDKAAFCSFGLDQSRNAAMGAEAVQKYVDGLNDLVRNHSRKLAGTLVVHWFKDTVPPADDPLAYLMGFDTDEQIEAGAQAAVRRLLESIRRGERADLGDNRYYAMTLCGAAGRVMVRDWMDGRFEELAGSIDAWFADLAIVARDGKALARPPKFMAVCAALVRDLKDLPAPTAATLWRVAVQAQPIPQALMAQALARFRADLVKDESFNHARVGLLRAYYVRQRRQEGASPMTTHLNPDHPDPAYHCGRLLALLANLQRAALGEVGAGVVQRYYAAASQTPGLILGRLITNARNHLGKLEPKLAWWFEERIAEVMGRLGDRPPRTLDLEGQGLFALGYYQQLAALRGGNKNDPTTTEQGDSTP